MGVNRGKVFEKQVHTAFYEVEKSTGICSIDRLYDPMSGYVGVRNICDFILYAIRKEFYLECKTTYGNRLPFSNITDNQWQGLLSKDLLNIETFGCILVWFIDHDITALIRMSTLEEMRINGAKSISYLEVNDLISKNKAVIFPGKKRRILFDYDVPSFLFKLDHIIFDGGDLK